MMTIALTSDKPEILKNLEDLDNLLILKLKDVSGVSLCDANSIQDF